MLAQFVFLYFSSQSRTVILGSSTTVNIGTLTANPVLPRWNWAASPRAVDLCFGMARTEAELWGAKSIHVTALHIWKGTTPPPAFSLGFGIAIAIRVQILGARWSVFL